MVVELIVLAVVFLGFVAWALLSGKFTKGKAVNVTKEPVTLHTEPGYRPDMDGPIGEKTVTNTTQGEPTGGNAQNMP